MDVLFVTSIAWKKKWQPILLVIFAKYDGEEIDVGVARSEAKTIQAFTANPPNEFAHALRTAIRCIISPHNLVYSKNTDEDALTHVVAMIAEKDLQMIKEMFYKRTNVTLEHAIAKETSGDYRVFLLASIGN
ncbi:hypothetical protein ZIOFF_057247 [Zingiber officinale]|uniref:Annexin n=1 Tax=Zingiber officinale TaxID=94328 RepID=A0A8J5KIA7_ZINOF|nr:hypothetical protein ZIOFF_057247 [Zingiber officinale]